QTIDEVPIRHLSAHRNARRLDTDQGGGPSWIIRVLRTTPGKGGASMKRTTGKGVISRRTALKAAAAIGAVPFLGPFIINARGEEPIKIGFNDPLTGTYAELGKNEQIGCELAVEQINAKGGILGRQVELLVEDSTSGDVGTAVQKARKLID